MGVSASVRRVEGECGLGDGECLNRDYCVVRGLASGQGSGLVKGQGKGQGKDQGKGQGKGQG